MVVRRVYSAVLGSFFSIGCAVAFGTGLGIVSPLPAAIAAEEAVSDGKLDGELNGELDLNRLAPNELEQTNEAIPIEAIPSVSPLEEGSDDALSNDALSNEALPNEALANTVLVEEVPEEILRTEIITGARSPLTGEPLTAVEYAQLQAELAAPAGGNLVSQDIKYLIFLLQLRRAIKPIVPFIQ